MQTLELLAPAKNLACGIAAIDHGADAVYIGAPGHGARAAAGNSLDDIKALCDYAHRFGAKVHVTVNTLIRDEEMEETLRMVDELAGIGVDALLIQDMGLLSRLCRNGLPGNRTAITFHASTQCDTRTAAKVKWLSSLGFSRVVLARELSVEEISAIHKAAPEVELEVFVHGALCVSYSGVCYASEYCFRRSANRGECAQFCRMAFDLLDADGRMLQRGRHFLSLKDLCQIDHLEELANAGACSFKIEGRLKDVDYVKNVVAAYSQRLNQIVAGHPDRFRRTSQGSVALGFTPDLRKTFNRGYTTYFLHGRQPGIANFDTPKALGEPVGRVKELRHDSFTVAGTAQFANGDGLCFVNDEHELEGFRVNRAVNNRLYPYKMPEALHHGTLLYRNNDAAFEKLLAGKTAERRLPVTMQFGLTADGFALSIDKGGTATVAFAHEKAKQPQADNIRRQLSKLGNTPYVCQEVIIDAGADAYFIPSSILTDLRRKAIETIRPVSPAAATGQPVAQEQSLDVWQKEYKEFPYLYNITNRATLAFYEQKGRGELLKWHPGDTAQQGNVQQQATGGKEETWTFPTGASSGTLLMQCRHCLRYSMGFCVRHGGRRPTWKEPLFLRLGDGRRFRLEFRCDECQMNVYSE